MAARSRRSMRLSGAHECVHTIFWGSPSLQPSPFFRERATLICIRRVHSSACNGRLHSVGCDRSFGTSLVECMLTFALGVVGYSTTPMDRSAPKTSRANCLPNTLTNNRMKRNRMHRNDPNEDNNPREGPNATPRNEPQGA